MDAIVEAIVGQNLEALRRSLRPGVNLNYISAGGAPIHWAALVADAEYVGLLLQFGADPNMLDEQYGQNAVHKAADRSVDILDVLYLAGTNLDLPDADGMTPLMYAAKSGRIDLVRYLVEHGANVRASDSSGKGPLHWSAVGGYFPELNAYLIQAGADPTAKRRR
jgi:ankyrin repeat protein